jgi:radical SAM superfamily enzyme YgiQ (UPF0313 family)
MRVLLIYPPWTEIYGRYQYALRAGGFMPSLGLCSLAAYLKNKGHEVEIIDAEAEGKGDKEVAKIVNEYKPGLIGLSATSPVFPSAVRLARLLKEKFSIPLVIGGVHVTVVPEEAMDAGDMFDYGVIGEGEETLLELIESLESGSAQNHIKGLIFREGKRLIRTEARPYIQNLDSLPIPDRGLLDLDRYTFSIPGKGVGRITLMMTNRGCPFNCIFCSANTMWGKKTRYRSVPKVLEEIEHIVGDLGIGYINVSDDTLTLNRERTRSICEGILAKKIRFKWEGMTRANAVDEDLLRLMKEAGLVRLSFGIESGDPLILEKIKKGVKLEEIKEAYRLASKLGIETRGSVMLGHPFETRKTAMKTLNFIRQLNDCMQVYINITTPFPGTELHRMATNGEGGIRLLTNDFSQYRRYGSAVMEVNDLTRSDLVKLQRKGFWMFYMTPRRIVYNLKRAGLRAGLLNALAFVRSLWR